MQISSFAACQDFKLWMHDCMYHWLLLSPTTSKQCGDIVSSSSVRPCVCMNNFTIYMITQIAPNFSWVLSGLLGSTSLHWVLWLYQKSWGSDPCSSNTLVHKVTASDKYAVKCCILIQCVTNLHKYNAEIRPVKFLWISQTLIRKSYGNLAYF